MKFSVTVIESEAGWGQKVDQVRKFDSADDAWKYHDKINAKNTATTTPSIYWRADPPVRIE